MSTADERSYGGQSATERALIRRARLIDVALTAMAENRWRSATLASICLDAQLNKRYFYESFTDLDALTNAVIEQVAAEVAAAAVTAYASVLQLPLPDQARATVDAIVGVLGTDPRKALVLLGGAASTPTSSAQRAAVIQGFTAILVDHARTIHDVELEADTLAATGPAFVIGGTAQAILSWAQGELAVTRAQLVDDIAALWITLGSGAAEIARIRLASNNNGRPA